MAIQLGAVQSLAHHLDRRRLQCFQFGKRFPQKFALALREKIDQLLQQRRIKFCRD